MGKKKISPKFYHGKNIKKSDSGRTPVRGEPSSFIDFYDKKTGRFHRRRVLNRHGFASKDYDMPDIHKDSKHVHDYSPQLKRLDDRDPTKEELRHIDKANKKRRFWR